MHNEIVKPFAGIGHFMDELHFRYHGREFEHAQTPPPVSTAGSSSMPGLETVSASSAGGGDPGEEPDNHAGDDGLPTSVLAAAAVIE